MNYNSPNGKDKMKKRRSRDVAYEGDPRYLLPLTFVANLYETLILEVNQRLVTVEGIHEKTMGVALEAAGGLYRRLVKKYPKSGEVLGVIMKLRMGHRTLIDVIAKALKLSQITGDDHSCPDFEDHAQKWDVRAGRQCQRLRVSRTN